MARFTWLHGRNTQTEWTEAEWVTQGPENTNIKEELPTESRGSDWTLHFRDSLCNEQGHKATAERAWVTVGFSQISWQEWFNKLLLKGISRQSFHPLRGITTPWKVFLAKAECWPPALPQWLTVVANLPGFLIKWGQHGFKAHKTQFDPLHDVLT